ncbi:two-component regulator propeller domain-containing protein [Spirosoma sp. KNUC1025]|uniref:ligand-binding sensor domain-containing protein n=1 Tax=Spirosoma sp. KNUC1025 TaxID=2894082 RepID=UPI00386BC527|nr:histidine kinase [Spirosoma sp. KNUC1025]
MMKYVPVYALLLIVFYTTCKGQPKTNLPIDLIKSQPKEAITSSGPAQITRTIRQDRKGNIWMAAFDGVFRYDGTSFTNMTRNVSSARFFSALEDRKGNLWFGSIGSGVYYYDGKSFRNFTTRDGLLNNEIVCIYEDKIGNIWFGANGGVSRYDGKSFRNFLLKEDSMADDRTGKTFPDFTRPPHEVNSIIEDKTGRFWFGTRDNAYTYDGNTFTVLTHQGQPFINVRTIIEDRKGTIWLGGTNGLWRYDGRTFTNLTQHFVGYIYEDKKGNLWTSSETNWGWALSRFDATTLSNKTPTVTELNPREGRMIFGILEDDKGNIWFGADGVYRYDGKTVTDFKK